MNIIIYIYAYITYIRTKFKQTDENNNKNLYESRLDGGCHNAHYC